MDPGEDPEDTLHTHRSREKTFIFDIVFDQHTSQVPGPTHQPTDPLGQARQGCPHVGGLGSQVTSSVTSHGVSLINEEVGALGHSRDR